MSQTKRNNPTESQEKVFTVDSQGDEKNEMPGVSRLLDRKKMETTHSRTAIKALDLAVEAKADELQTYAPPPPGGELDLGASLNNSSMADLLDLRPDQKKSDVKETAPSGMGQVELNPNEISDPGLSLDLGPIADTAPLLDPIQDAPNTASHSHLPFDMPSQSEIVALTQKTKAPDRPTTPPAGTLNEGLIQLGDGSDQLKRQSILGGGSSETQATDSPVSLAPPPQTEVRNAKRRRGPDQGLVAQFSEDTIFSQMSKAGSLSQLLSFLTSVGMGSALVLQDGGGEVVSTLALDAGHRSTVWRALKWNPSAGGDSWTQLNRQQFCELAPTGKLPEGAPPPTANLIKNGLRASFGVEGDDFLTLLQIEFPEFGRGVLAIVTPTTIQHSMNRIRPLLKVSGPAPGLLAA